METLKLKDKDNIYFTSDLHLGHENTIHHTGRPFKTVEEMDNALIDNWNNTVNDDSIIFVLGDYCWRMSTEIVKKYTDALRGNKVLILGNHDKRKSYPDFTVYDSVVNLRIEDADAIDGRERGYQRITLCHYPMLSWYQSHRGAWQLHGHWHNFNTSREFQKRKERGFSGQMYHNQPYLKEEHMFMVNTRSTQYDVGVDGNGYRPISYNNIKEIISTQISYFLIKQ